MRPWIDTGHLNADSGAVAGGKVEVKRNDALADAVEALSRIQGWSVGSTNEKDAHTTLSERVANAKAYNADVFISIHHDWDKGRQAVIYPRNHDITSSRRLADFINRRIDPLAPTAGCIYADRRGLAVLNGTDMPAVIIEASRVQDSYDVPKMAAAIVRGICDYKGVEFRPTATTPPVSPSIPPVPAKPKTPGTKYPLKKGEYFGIGEHVDHGTTVKRIQLAVGLKGSHVDGKYGPETKRYVAAAQRKHRISDDGVVGPESWKHFGL